MDTIQPAPEMKKLSHLLLASHVGGGLGLPALNLHLAELQEADLLPHVPDLHLIVTVVNSQRLTNQIL
jgi:hypothetical protein